MVGIFDLKTIPNAPQVMTCEEFYETKEDIFNEMIQEQFWSGGPRTESMWSALKLMATDENVTLSDVDEFNYDTFFYNCYRSTEKGLS